MPSEEEWNFAADVVEWLRVFNDITLLFSGTKYITANIYFIKIVRLGRKSDSGQLGAVQRLKRCQLASDIQRLMGIATLLDPHLKKLSLLMFF